MIKELMHDPIFLAGKSEVATKEDLQVAQNLLDTLMAHRESSGEGLNFLYDAYIRSQLTNMHGSIPSDCPHRERLGYTGDGQVCAPAAMLLLDSKEFYRRRKNSGLCKGFRGWLQSARRC